MTKIGVSICLILILLVGNFTYKYIQTAKYGTLSVTSESTIYKNHDLMVGFDDSGKINLLGHGAFARGYYSVSFTNPEAFQAFLANRKSDLSDDQKSWLNWVLKEENFTNSSDTLALID